MTVNMINLLLILKCSQGWGVEYDSPDDVEWDEVELQADDEQSTLEEEIELVDSETGKTLLLDSHTLSERSESCETDQMAKRV